MLEQVFIQLASQYSEDVRYIKSLWKTILKRHSKASRYYHNLSHLEHLYQNLLKVKQEISDWDVVLFALFYHDYIYNVLKHDNEEQSAQKAVKILNSLSVEAHRIVVCSSIILATKGHQISTNKDVNYFTDADLAILGSSWQEYKTYATNVRKEYKYYPDFTYRKGRVKVLRHFMDMPRIFKTDYFHHEFETQAKENLQREIDSLSN